MSIYFPGFLDAWFNARCCFNVKIVRNEVSHQERLYNNKNKQGRGEGLNLRMDGAISHILSPSPHFEINKSCNKRVPPNQPIISLLSATPSRCCAKIVFARAKKVTAPTCLQTHRTPLPTSSKIV